jgi:hypothetical protein
MIKAIITIFFLICGSITYTVAQDDEPDTRRELYTVLEYGDQVFEPGEWFVYAAKDSETSSYVAWKTREDTTIGSITIVHFTREVTTDVLVEYLDKAIFNESLAEVATWEFTNNCEKDGTLLYEFSLTWSGGTLKGDSIGRYWAEPKDGDAAWFTVLVFPMEKTDLLNEYAAAFYPLFVSCTSSNIGNAT